jgi:drug/metabolite transporter superfamily protein YnfA
MGVKKIDGSYQILAWIREGAAIWEGQKKELLVVR